MNSCTHKSNSIFCTIRTFFPLFLRQKGQGFGKLPARKDNPLTAYRNRVLLTRVYKIFICCTEWVKLFFGEVFKGIAVIWVAMP